MTKPTTIRLDDALKKRIDRLAKKLEQVEHFGLGDHATKAHVTGALHRDHNSTVRVENAKDVETLTGACDVTLFDVDYFGYSLCGINRFVTNFEFANLGSLLDGHGFSLQPPHVFSDLGAPCKSRYSKRV
jgi:hypothetical protein